MKKASFFAIIAVVAGIVGVIFPEPSRADAPSEKRAAMPAVAQLPGQAAQGERCPYCNGLPEYSLLRDSGITWIVCHDCGKEWQFQRIKCPYCGNQNPYSLSFTYAENEGMPSTGFYVCKECNQYIKTTDAGFRKPAVLTILQKSMVNQLEWEVQNLGYRPGWMK